jgi:hypothetical protein
MSGRIADIGVIAGGAMAIGIKESAYGGYFTQGRNQIVVPE